MSFFNFLQGDLDPASRDKQPSMDPLSPQAAHEPVTLHALLCTNQTLHQHSIYICITNYFKVFQIS